MNLKAPVGDTGLINDMDKVKNELTTDEEDSNSKSELVFKNWYGMRMLYDTYILLAPCMRIATT